jgi:hypothetical protein
MDYMKKMYIEDCSEYNKIASIHFKLNPKDIFYLILIDEENNKYYLYQHIQFLQHNCPLKELKVNKEEVINYISKSFEITDLIYNQILEIDLRTIKGYYKNNFLKLIELEELII